MSFEWLEPYSPWLSLVHVFSAIVALGGNVGYVFWLSQRVTGPAYGLLLVTGIVMILAEGWSISEPWLLTGIVLYFVSAGVAFVGLNPALRAQLSAAEQDTSGLAYASAARRSRQLAWLVVAIVAVVVWLMVVKPTV